MSKHPLRGEGYGGGEEVVRVREGFEYLVKLGVATAATTGALASGEGLLVSFAASIGYDVAKDGATLAKRLFGQSESGDVSPMGTVFAGAFAEACRYPLDQYENSSGWREMSEEERAVVGDLKNEISEIERSPKRIAELINGLDEGFLSEVLDDGAADKVRGAFSIERQSGRFGDVPAEVIGFILGWPGFAKTLQGELWARIRKAEVDGGSVWRNWVGLNLRAIGDDLGKTSENATKLSKEVDTISTKMDGLVDDLISGLEELEERKREREWERKLEDVEGYLNVVKGRASSVSLSALVTKDAASPLLKLLDLYVDLDSTLERTDLAGERRVLSLVDCMVRFPALVVLAPAGFGKTTFSHYLTVALAESTARAGGSGSEGAVVPRDLRGSIPILIHLREFIEWQKRRAAPSGGAADAGDLADIEDYLADEFRQVSVDPSSGFRELLSRGRVVVIFDGLDEIENEHGLRERASQLICEFKWRYGGRGRLRVVVTCRNEAFLSECEQALGDFATVGIAPLSDRRRKRVFAEKYLDVLGRRNQRGDGVRDAGTLMEQICDERRRGIEEMIDSPLLMALAVVLYDDGGELPDSRAKLYWEGADLLITRWDSHAPGRGKKLSILDWMREHAPNRPDDELRRELTFGLARVCYDAICAADGEANRVPSKLVRDLLGGFCGGDHGKTENGMNRFRERVRLFEGGLGGEPFQPQHRTFAEFLAGVHVVETCGLVGDFDKLMVRSPAGESGGAAGIQPKWGVVFELGAGYAARVVERKADAVLLVMEILERGGKGSDFFDEELRGKVEYVVDEILAGCGVRELEEFSLAGRMEIGGLRSRLVGALGDYNLDARTRDWAGRRLVVLGDPRDGVGVRDGVPDVKWVGFEGGRFTMGSDPAKDTEDLKSDDDEFFGGKREKGAWQGVEVDGFSLAAYPVTGAQYRCFVEDRNRNREDEAGERCADNAPQTGVSWYQATAFCEWLTGKLEEAGSLDAGEVIRLPDEREWEYAARYQNREESLVFPWADSQEGLERRANFGGNVGRASVVGCFAEGNVRGEDGEVCDLIGNVWEWCCNEPQVYGETRVVEGEEGLRAMRGGSWWGDSGDCRAARRDASHPGLRGDFVGFRLVRARRPTG